MVRGEPGVGKTVLLDYLAGRASGCRVARAAGVQSEMELAFAALHQLCAPMLDHAESLPDPQREALRTAFGLSAGPVPDRFRVGLAVLGLLSEAAGERPLVCVVDDQQWLDRASAQALGFAARRLAADPVGLVFAARVPGEDVAGLPELVVDGLAGNDARELLESVLTGLTGPLDAQVRDRIIADTHGNPLALLELPRGLTPAQLTGGFGRSAMPLAGRIEESFGRQLEALPAQTRRLVQLAAADPTGDPVLVWRAAGRLAIGAGAAGPAAEADLVEFGAGVRFRHPLVRSAAYRSASVQTRQELHGALAEATDQAADPDRRAWHRAQAAPGPDEEVAAELEQSAGRAQRRGGLAAAAAFLERSAGLTLDPARRAQRALAAAQAKHQAGALDAALGLLAMAQAGPLDELQRARGDLLRAQIAFASSHGRDAPPLMLSAAKQLEALDVGLARQTYLEAFTAALFVGRLSPAVGDVARAARMAPAPQGPARAPDLLLDGLALLVTDGYAAGTPALRRALLTVRSQDISAEGLSWLWLAERAAMAVWDDETWHILASRHLKLARDAGALSELPLAVRSRILVHTHAGELQQGAALIAEAQAVADATGTQLGPYGAMGIAAFRGYEAEATELIQATKDGVTSRGEGRGLTSGYAAALLYNGLGHYDKALAAAELACEYDDIDVLGWSLTELVEAAVRSGQLARASDALQRLTEITRASGTDWALGTEARSRALLSEGETAENCYREAIERLGRTRMRPAVARAHLLYGEWLRRQNRRRDARAQLRTAHGLFTTMGIEAFAERARRELLATGDTVRKRTAETASELTAQEAHIARLAAGGRTNVEIGAQLFLSTRTVEWHLSKVYTKLGVGSRRELRRALAGPGQADPHA